MREIFFMTQPAPPCGDARRGIALNANLFTPLETIATVRKPLIHYKAFPAALSAASTVCAVSGCRRTRTPVASNIAFAIAAAVGFVDGSPTPLGGMNLPAGLLPSGLMRNAFTAGISLISMVGYVIQSTALTFSESKVTPS